MRHHRLLDYSLKSFALLVMLFLPLVSAQTQQPAAVESNTASELDPEVVITDDGKSTIKEFKRQGQIYKIEITPEAGVPYFLYDADGDGQFEPGNDDLGEQKETSKWRLFQW